ncbi:MAG: 2OG-Fe dioxygenase family protein [Alphaproteobacteria bacterium]|nr:2OG-Fe dioxygenase family protein [Alphaproteobacteria bacterium]
MSPEAIHPLPDRQDRTFFEQVLEPGQCLIMRDEDMVHGACDIRAASSDGGYRDIWVISITPGPTGATGRSSRSSRRPTPRRRIPWPPNDSAGRQTMLALTSPEPFTDLGAEEIEALAERHGTPLFV